MELGSVDSFFKKPGTEKKGIEVGCSWKRQYNNQSFFWLQKYH